MQLQSYLAAPFSPRTHKLPGMSEICADLWTDDCRPFTKTKAVREWHLAFDSVCLTSLEASFLLICETFIDSVKNV